MPKLFTKNISIGERGPRTSVRLEDPVWDALREICVRENVSIAALMMRVNESETKTGTFSSALRMFILNYFREAATEEGHAGANHGLLNQRVN